MDVFQREEEEESIEQMEMEGLGTKFRKKEPVPINQGAVAQYR